MIAGTFDEGIREQHARLARRLGEGMPRAGWKVCVNDSRTQRKLGIESSFVGFLEGSRRLASGECWPAGEGSILGVEPEFAVRFGAAIAAPADVNTIRRAIRGVAPAIEIVDWRDASLDLHAMASSSSFHAGFVVGELRSLECVPAIADDCPRFVRGDERLGAPDSSLVPADLSGLVANVADFLARYGQRIEAGD
ncbi:MAG: hypothetical protein ABR587_04680, partial [Candidatus Binatia bacterium]